MAILILVWVTWFYAKRTQDLVDEQQKYLEEAKKKNNADFGEKRIAEFHKPFIDQLNTMISNINRSTLADDAIIEILNSAHELFLRKKYMASKETCEFIDELRSSIFFAHVDSANNEDEINIMIAEFRQNEKKVREIIVTEWNALEDQIRNFYGY